MVSVKSSRLTRRAVIVTANKDEGHDLSQGITHIDTQLLSLAVSVTRAPVNSLAEAKHRLHEDDERQEPDHGYAHGGHGFEDGAILRLAAGPNRGSQGLGGLLRRL